MQTIEETINTIAEAGKNRVTTVNLQAAVNINVNGVSRINYYSRAWRLADRDLCIQVAATDYTLEGVQRRMLEALAKMTLPETDKQKQIDKLKAELARLES